MLAMTRPVIFGAFLTLTLSSLVAAGTGTYPSVAATVETDPVGSAGDAADDPAIWIHPTDASLSLIIGTDKLAGLSVYDLSGKELQRITAGQLNNVDVRQNVTIGGRTMDLVAASNVDVNGLNLYRMDPESRRLEPVSPGVIPTQHAKTYGFALHREPQTGRVHAFISSKKGPVQHLALEMNDAGDVIANVVRSIPFGTKVEALAADDEAGILYVGEEEVGLWAVPIDPTVQEMPRLVHAAGPSGPLVPDIEGIAIFDGGEGKGFIIASSQGDHSFAVFDRQSPQAYLYSFRVEGVEDTDGIEITSLALGSAFPQGVLVVQDGKNEPKNQNFKLIPWERVEALKAK